MRWFTGMLVAGAMAAAALIPAAALGAAPALAAAKLPCSARMSDSKPADGKSTTVRVSTGSKARVVAVAHFRSATTRKTARADSSGDAYLVFDVGKAAYGYKVVVKVDVYRGSRDGSCSTSFTPTAPRAKVYAISSCRASGEFATCVESGQANKPLVIQVHVTASPDQSVFVDWNDVCSLGYSAAGSSGEFTATTPITRTIGHSFKHPDSCTVGAGGSLNDGGSLHVWTTYTR